MRINAYSLDYLVNINHARTNSLANNSQVWRVNYDKKTKSLLTFLTKSGEKYSSKSGHIQNLFYVDTPKDVYSVYANCLVFCSCPAFKWWGTQFNATALEYNYGEAMDIAPNERDPNAERLLCKHLVAVYNNLKKLKYNKRKKSGLEILDYDDPLVVQALGFICETDREFEKVMLHSVLKGKLI